MSRPAGSLWRGCRHHILLRYPIWSRRFRTPEEVLRHMRRHPWQRRLDLFLSGLQLRLRAVRTAFAWLCRLPAPIVFALFCGWLLLIVCYNLARSLLLAGWSS